VLEDTDERLYGNLKMVNEDRNGNQANGREISAVRKWISRNADREGLFNYILSRITTIYGLEVAVAFELERNSQDIPFDSWVYVSRQGKGPGNIDEYRQIMDSFSEGQKSLADIVLTADPEDDKTLNT